MYTNVSNKLTASLLANEIIQKDEAEFCFIGFQCGLTLITNVACVLVAGAFLSILAESVVFIISFYLLRIVANGFHTKSIDSCFCFSCVVEIAVLLCIKHFTANLAGAIVIVIIMIVILGRFCPVPNENKQYSEKETKVFRKLGLVVFGIQLAIWIMFSLANLPTFCNAILHSWGLYSILNVLGHLQNASIKSKSA